MAFESGLSGKVAIVTGGSRGIGRAIVELLAGQGANVTFFYRGNQAAADEVVAGVHAAGGQATAMQVDVSDSAACAAAVEAVAERCERIDILVNNAGIVRDNLMAAMEDDEISDVLNTNVGGVFNVTRPVIPYMMSQRAGRIVNLSSVAGNKAGRGQANYAASKAGMVAMTKSIARGFAGEGILAFAICPGFTMTGMAEEYLASRGGDKLLADIPLGRVADPEEVARAAVWLALEAPASMTGAVLDINGASFVR